MLVCTTTNNHNILQPYVRLLIQYTNAYDMGQDVKWRTIITAMLSTDMVDIYDICHGTAQIPRINDGGVDLA